MCACVRACVRVCVRACVHVHARLHGCVCMCVHMCVYIVSDYDVQMMLHSRIHLLIMLIFNNRMFSLNKQISIIIYCVHAY